jgi:hypothetical protein
LSAKPALLSAKPALLSRRSSLTDSQKKEKREIMEILLDSYEFVPARITRRGSSTQGKAELSLKAGNVVVVFNPPVDANEDWSGFETVKSRRTSVNEKKELRGEQDAILSVLADFKEPAKQASKKNQNGKQQTQTAQQQKVAPKATNHIQAKGNQARAKVAT